MSKLSLFFFDSGFEDFMRIDWPSGRPRLQAYIGTDPGRVMAANIGIIMANTPKDHTIYFAAGSDLPFEHANVKRDLNALKVPFEEKVITIGEATVGLFRRRRVERKGQFVFGSTNRRDVIDVIFDRYRIAWYGEGWSFIFFVSREEPPGWREIIDTLSRGESIPPNLILQSHCILKTRYEHGIAIASTTITRDQLIDIATNVARQLSMDLSVEISTGSVNAAVDQMKPA